jgi:hypothetical protein
MIPDDSESLKEQTIILVYYGTKGENPGDPNNLCCEE